MQDTVLSSMSLKQLSYWCYFAFKDLLVDDGFLLITAKIDSYNLSFLFYYLKLFILPFMHHM